MTIPAIEFDKRHLHWSADDDTTLCGCVRWVQVRAGSRVWREPGHPSVHVSKARKGTDCAACRAILRADVLERRAEAQAQARRTTYSLDEQGFHACIDYSEGVLYTFGLNGDEWVFKVRHRGDFGVTWVPVYFDGITPNEEGQ